MLFIALVLACPAPSDGPTDTDTETSAPETESEVDERALDLESSDWWRVDQATWLPEQSAENWCVSPDRDEWDWVDGVSNDAGDCWTQGGSCLQDLQFSADGTLYRWVYFIVRRCDDGEDVPVQGVEDYGTWSYVGDDGDSRSNYEIDGSTWMVTEADAFNWNVTVAGHVFTIAPESLEIPITE